MNFRGGAGSTSGTGRAAGPITGGGVSGSGASETAGAGPVGITGIQRRTNWQLRRKTLPAAVLIL